MTLDWGTTKLNTPDARSPIIPVIVLNPSPTPLRTVVFGVFLGNLLMAIIVAVALALNRL